MGPILLSLSAIQQTEKAGGLFGLFFYLPTVKGSHNREQETRDIINVKSGEEFLEEGWVRDIFA